MPHTAGPKRMSRTPQLVPLAVALALSVPAGVRAQSNWMLSVPPDRLLHWHPRTAADFAHPESLFAAPAGTATARPMAARTSALPGSGAWQELGPPARAAHSLALDSRRHAMILVGGLPQQDPTGSVWSFSLPAGGWSPIANLPFSTRGEWDQSVVESAVYDSLRDQLLVLHDDGQLELDALALGSGQWAHVWSGPLPGGDPPVGMAIDTRRDQVAILGVWDPVAAAQRLIRVPLADPTSWTWAVTQGPEPQPTPLGQAAYDPSRDAFNVLFNDEFGTGSSQLWALSAGASPAWSAIALPAYPRRGHASTLALDGLSGRLLLVDEHGLALALSPVDGSAQWLTSSAPATRYQAAVLFDPVSRRLFLDGGSQRGGELYQGDSATPMLLSAAVDSGVTWTPDAPAAGVSSWTSPGDYEIGSRWLQGALFDPVGSKLLITGGYGLSAVPGGVAIRSLASGGGWTALGAGSDSLPRPALGQGAVIDPTDDALLTYGGQASDGTGDLLAGLWKLPLTPSGRWQKIEPQGVSPGPLRGCAFVYDAPRARFLLLGGDDLSQWSLKVWELRLLPSPAWRQLTVVGQMPPYPSLFADDRDGSAWCVSFGAYPVGHVLLGDDVVQFQPADSTATSAPPDLFFAGFDPVQMRMLWFEDRSGGYSVNLDQMYFTSLLGGPPLAWQLSTVATGGPTSRGGMAIVFDPSTSRLVIDGGLADNGAYFADTWALQLPLDQATAALASLASASADAAGAHLEWSVSSGAVAALTVQRSRDGTAWQDAGPARRADDGRAAFDDRALTAGTRLAYRLRVSLAGDVTTTSPVWLEGVPGSRGLALEAVANPARGALAVRFSLGSGAPAHLRLLDVSGRLVSETTVSSSAAAYDFGSPPAPGLYFAELSQGSAKRITRLVAVP